MINRLSLPQNSDNDVRTKILSNKLDFHFGHHLLPKMSKVDPGSSLEAAREDPRKHDKSSRQSKRLDFVYVNSAYVGSVDNVNQSRIQPPPSTVIREQYWACSKWPMGQRILALTVGVLLGTVIGLTILVVLRGDDNIEIPTILRRAPVED